MFPPIQQPRDISKYIPSVGRLDYLRMNWSLQTALCSNHDSLTLSEGLKFVRIEFAKDMMDAGIKLGTQIPCDLRGGEIVNILGDPTLLTT